MAFAGFSLAQSLNIPTNLDNAIIAIKKIILSPSGTVSDENDSRAKISLDGEKGDATIGNTLTVNNDVLLKKSDFSTPNCDGTTGCILKVVNGKVQSTKDVTPWLGTGEQSNVFKRNPNNPQDSFFATKEGTASTVGKNNFLRIGAINNNNITAAKADAAMVVAGSIESRGGNFIRKVDGV